MQRVAMSSLVLVLAACATKVASGPSLEGWERSQAFDAHKDSPAQYAGDPKVLAPVLPVMAFGAAFDVSVALRSKHPGWAMHEIGRMATPAGDVWMALETRADTNDQTLILDAKEPQLWMPELPMNRKGTEITVDDTSTDEGLAVALSYENADGQRVEIAVESEPPHKAQEERNGDPMGRSSNVALSAYDIQHRESAFAASVSVAGQSQRMEKEGGMVPSQWTMEQAFGGLAIGSFDVLPGAEVEWSNAATQTFFPLQMAPAPMASEMATDEAPVEEEAEVEEASVADEFDMDEEDDFDMGEEPASEEAPAEEEAAVEGERGGEGALTRPEEAADDADEGERGGEGALTRPEAADEAAEEPAEEEAADDAGDAPAIEALALEEDMLEELPVVPDEGDLSAVGYATPSVADFSTMHYLQDGSKVEQNWSVQGGDGMLSATQTTDLRTLAYNFIVDEEWGAFELSTVTVTQFGRGVPTTAVTFSPALPDLRRPFNGRLKSNFVVDINGQRSSMHGTVDVWWTDSGPKLQLVPAGPEWVEGQDMVTTISYGVPGQASVRIKRVTAE